MFTYRRTIPFSAVYCLVVAMFLGNFSPAQSVVQSRIAGPVRDEQRSALRSTTPVLVKRSLDAGRLPASQKLGHMRPMHAVEVSHTHECGTEVGRDVLEFVEDEHRKEKTGVGPQASAIRSSDA